MEVPHDVLDGRVPGHAAGRLDGMGPLSIVPITAADLPFVREMLHAAASWRSSTDRPSIDHVLDDPQLATYVRDWGRAGDEGLVARAGPRPVGAVWVRRFADADHGYGYVDERTPELSIAVTAGYRGHGIGRCLVTAMLAQLRLDGAEQVSLSVEIDNPARRLYEELGFASLEDTGGAVTMVRTLA